MTDDVSQVLAMSTRDLIARYAREHLDAPVAGGNVPRVKPKSAKQIRQYLTETLALVGEAGLLTAPTSMAQLAFRTSGWPQDRRKADRIGAILVEFREWVAGH